MADEPSTQQPPAAQPAAQQPAQPSAKTFTQEDVDALVGNVRKEGRTKGAQEAIDKLLGSLKEKGLNFSSVDELIEHAAGAPKKQQTAEQQLSELQKKLSDAESGRKEVEQALFMRDMRDEVRKHCGDLHVIPSEQGTVWAVLQSDEKTFDQLVKQYDAEKGFVGVKEAIEKLIKDHPAWVSSSKPMPPIGQGTRTPVKPNGSGQPSNNENRKVLTL